MKICSRCRVSKRDNEFHVCRSNGDNLNSYCKLCMRDYRRDKRGLPRKVRIYKVKDIEQDAELAARAKAYNLANPVRLSDDIRAAFAIRLGRV